MKLKFCSPTQLKSYSKPAITLKGNCINSAVLDSFENLFRDYYRFYAYVNSKVISFRIIL